ncbi:MAG: alanine racemase, partial [Myxococcota bacterium]
QEGAGAEVASAGEIVIAGHVGFKGENMQFAGPGKHGDDFQLALKHGVTLNIESVAELEAFSATAHAAQVQAPIALRVNPPDAKAGSRMRMGGGSAKFGIDIDALPAVAKHARTLPGINLMGLHTYAGTQTFEYQVWLDHAAFHLDAARRVE